MRLCNSFIYIYLVTFPFPFIRPAMAVGDKALFLYRNELQLSIDLWGVDVMSMSVALR